MTPTPEPQPIATPLALAIPPLELSAEAAYDLLSRTDAATLPDPDFDRLVIGYRAKRQRLAQAIAERARAKPKRKSKAAPAPDQQSDGEGNAVQATTIDFSDGPVGTSDQA